MRLSVIIPAYNAEQHLMDCLISLTKQKIAVEDFEIIVVDDGSTDTTAKIVTNFAKYHKNIRLESQKNMGNGAARNTGVQISKGYYIYFLDADDYLAEDTLKNVIEVAEKNDLDIIGFNTKKVSNSNHTASKNRNSNTTDLKVTTGIEFLAQHNYEAEVWWYITKKSFYLNTGTTFYDRKFVQDSYLTPTLFSKATKVIFMDYDVHRYRMSLNSITRKKSIAHLNQHFNDLSFSVKKLYELRMQLLENGVSNTNCIKRLHVKQQRYVFIIITRFIKSPLPLPQLKNMLNGFIGLEAYPLSTFMSLKDYRSIPYHILTCIYNRTWLLYPLTRIYRTIKMIN
jgi:glycosyltransferase involved in cell wall biosynthesis